MKLTLRVGAAIGIVALAACAQGRQDNVANMEADTEMMTNETGLPADETSTETDTLGNQLDETNDSASTGGEGNSTNSE